MPFIDQGEIVVGALSVFLLMMLFASVYLFLAQVFILSCRARDARKFLAALAKVRSLQQVQELLDRQATIKSFSLVTHRILAGKKMADARALPAGQQGGAQGVLARRLIAHEAAEQAVGLHQGLKILAAMVWVAPLTGLVATVWRGRVWGNDLALVQLGLLTALIALLAYLCLSTANRRYFSQFILFRRLLLSILEPGARSGANGKESAK